MKLSATGIILTYLNKFGSVKASQVTPALAFGKAMRTLKALEDIGRIKQQTTGVYVLVGKGENK